MKKTSFKFLGAIGIAGLSTLGVAQTALPAAVQPLSFAKPQPSQLLFGSNNPAPREKAEQINVQGGIPPHEPIVVTPQVESAITATSQKLQQVNQQVFGTLDQKYEQTTANATEKLNENGYSVTKVVTRTPGNLQDHSFEYYISGPNGGFVEVTSSNADGWVVIGGAVQKTVYVDNPKSAYPSEVQVVIDRPDAKATLIVKSSIPLSPKALEAAIAVAANRDNIIRVIPPPMSPQ